MKRYLRVLLAGLMLIAILGLLRRAAASNFTTIAQGEQLISDENMPAQLFVLNSIADVHAHAHLFPEELTRIKLESVDYANHSVLVVFGGMKPSGGYGITVTEVEIAGDHVSVRATFAEPAPTTLRIAAITSPYHLIQTDRKIHPGSQVQLGIGAQIVLVTVSK